MRGMGIYVVFTLINIRGMMKAYGYILLCCLGLLCGAVGKALAASMHGGGEYVTISGIVKDRSDKKALAYASVSVAGGTESTVANADGEFTFKVKAPVEGKIGMVLPVKERFPSANRHTLSPCRRVRRISRAVV